MPPRATVPADDRADVERARQRLAVPANRDATITDIGQARAAVARLKDLMAADSSAALKAFGAVSTSLFEAATGRPTA